VLHLSQSATSGVLARLRDYFDDELLVLVGRTMVLTPLAESLAEPVHDVLLQIRSTLETKPGFDASTSTRHFRIVASDYMSTVLIAKCARELKKRAPKITLEVLSPGQHAFAKLERAEIDLLTLPVRYLVDGQPSEELFQDRHCCVVDRDNHLVQGDLSLEQYLSMGHVAADFGSRDSSFEAAFLSSKGWTRRVEVTADTFGILPQFVLGTDRIATIHTRMAREYLRYFPLRMIASPVEFPPVSMHMQWHKSMSRELSHIWLRSLLLEVAARTDVATIEQKRAHPLAVVR